MDLSVLNDLEITASACRDNIQSLLDEIRDEDDIFMQILVDLKEQMHITWQQPWYQRTGWLTRKLEQKEDEMDKFDTHKMTKSECDRIHRNWLKFVKKFDVPDQPISLARWRSKGISKKSKYGSEEYVRRYIISYLARGLKRNLHQVFQHFVACYGGPNKGPYTKLEIKVIEMCFYHFPNDAIQYAARLLSREARGIQTRLKENVKEKPQKKKRVKWSLVNATKLVKLLMKYTDLSLEELKYKKIDRSVWSKLETDMDKSAKSLHKFWFYYLHVQLFVKSDLKMQTLRKKIIEKIRTYPYQVWTDIRWQELVKHFPDGVTAGFLYNICFKVAYFYKNYLKAPLDDVLNFVLQSIKTYPNKRLKPLVLNNDGMLEVTCYKKNKD